MSGAENVTLEETLMMENAWMATPVRFVIS